MEKILCLPKREIVQRYVHAIKDLHDMVLPYLTSRGNKKCEFLLWQLKSGKGWDSSFISYFHFEKMKSNKKKIILRKKESRLKRTTWLLEVEVYQSNQNSRYSSFQSPWGSDKKIPKVTLCRCPQRGEIPLKHPFLWLLALIVD